MGRHPLAHALEVVAAELSRDKRADKHRGDTLKDLQHRTLAVAIGVEHNGGNEGDDDIAEECVGSHSFEVGAQHSGNDDSGHSDGCQDTHHSTLCKNEIERAKSVEYG